MDATDGELVIAERTSRQNVRRLLPDQLEALVAGYRSGQTVYQLASRFQIHRTTVSAHLHRAGIAMRGQGLTDDAIAEAARRYNSGWSLARIGDHLNVDTATVRSALKAQGLPMRDTHGRPR